jgi:glucuronate isomerase
MMMDRQAWHDEVLRMPVFDTHTHLNKPGVPVPARDFWDIAHYFWFLEELWAVGYPRDAARLPEDTRIAHFVRAFEASRNTVWNQIVRQIFENLYGIMLNDAQSVQRADAAVRESFGQPDWSRKVIDRLAIRHIAVNNLQDYEFPELPGVGVAVPSRGDFDQAAWVQRIWEASDQRAMAQEAVRALESTVEALYAKGVRGMRVSFEPFEILGFPGAPSAVQMSDDLPKSGASKRWIEAFLTHALLRVLNQYGSLSSEGMFAQVFLGIARRVTSHTSMAVNDPRRITNLYPLFERYPSCGFELVIGAPQNNLDAAQPARIYPNVHVGGLWWYNFRSSTYRQAMQYRLEAVPASKCALIASDARSIQWCYGKILLVKRLLADFLYTQVEGGWLTWDNARWVAREWLHDAAARRYLPGRSET